MLSVRVAALPDADPDSSDDPLGPVLTLMRLSRALERVDSGLSPQQYRILKLAGAGGERSARLAERLAVARAPGWPGARPSPATGAWSGCT
jgi:hypothetical protein